MDADAVRAFRQCRLHRGRAVVLKRFQKVPKRGATTRLAETGLC